MIFISIIHYFLILLNILTLLDIIILLFIMKKVKKNCAFMNTYDTIIYH